MSHKTNAQSTIVKRYKSNIFKLKKSTSVKNPGAHSSLKILANQDLKPMLG